MCGFSGKEFLRLESEVRLETIDAVAVEESRR